MVSEAVISGLENCKKSKSIPIIVVNEPKVEGKSEKNIEEVISSREYARIMSGAREINTKERSNLLLLFFSQTT